MAGINFPGYPNITKITIPTKTICNENFSNAFRGMGKLINCEFPYSNITNMSYVFYNCRNYKGSPVCGDNVTNMRNAYYNCRNITGSPVCGDNVTDMCHTYYACSNLTGSPVCGENVTNMVNAYSHCNFSGASACGSNVTNMAYTYYGCTKLTGPAICGPNVTNMCHTYWSCRNLRGNAYFYSNNVTNVANCFYERNTSNMMNIYVHNNSVTLNSLKNMSASTSIHGKIVSWSVDKVNNFYYNTSYNVYIYPVDNVAQARANNGD